MKSKPITRTDDPQSDSNLADAPGAGRCKGLEAAGNSVRGRIVEAEAGETGVGNRR
jgi:hypothetical protein